MPITEDALYAQGLNVNVKFQKTSNKFLVEPCEPDIH